MRVAISSLPAHCRYSDFSVALDLRLRCRAGSAPRPRHLGPAHHDAEPRHHGRPGFLGRPRVAEQHGIGDALRRAEWLRLPVPLRQFACWMRRVGKPAPVRKPDPAHRPCHCPRRPRRGGDPVERLPLCDGVDPLIGCQHAGLHRPDARARVGNLSPRRELRRQRLQRSPVDAGYAA